MADSFLEVQYFYGQVKQSIDLSPHQVEGVFLFVKKLLSALSDDALLYSQGQRLCVAIN